MFADLLRRRYSALGPEQVAALESHYELLVRWNRKLNLTAITGAEEAVERHYGESLFLASHLPAGALRIVDVGSGAGFPGIPVAVQRRDCSVALVESHQRKAVFLREATRQLRNVQVIAKRAEEVTEQFDWAISRAVSYEDLRQPLHRLAQHAALLTGAMAPVAQVASSDPRFTWEDPVPLPGALHRFLRIGHLCFK